MDLVLVIFLECYLLLVALGEELFCLEATSILVIKYILCRIHMHTVES